MDHTITEFLCARLRKNITLKHADWHGLAVAGVNGLPEMAEGN